MREAFLFLLVLCIGPAWGGDLPASWQLKVEGDLHGVIQDRLPVTVSAEFATPGKRELLLSVPDVASRTVLLKDYLYGKRTELIRRLGGPGLEIVETYDMLSIVGVRIETFDALARVLGDPDVVSVYGDFALTLDGPVAQRAEP